ncbi:alpha/beta fold hydrolase [Motilimonas cestriensis]|uniref:Alpha/beta fold hydrolase n=1 Tax=Motilimonas cestriensis TaxID=2742685 RepID=A0ABS8WDM8_9GAMM|nr:alpha/beta fold hydrolase [Motilimonas cestriensis]MCE2597151.1 alpha/beta fold hydrolase [Motilimonas cestriensis]
MKTAADYSPYPANFLDRNGLKYHYINEGSGDPVVMVHGNPSWSYYYRELVAELRDSFQTIVPDHIGMGLSDKPGDDRYEYTLTSRIDDLEALLQHLGINKNITLVVHDWGGMIGMGYAARHPEQIKKIVALNTAAFHMPKAKKLPKRLFMGRNTAIGEFLIRRFNAFSSLASYIGVKRAPMPADVRQAFVAPYNNWQNRIATVRFVQDIPLEPGDKAYELVSSIEASLSQFADIPVFLGFGLQDFVFDKHFLAQWKHHFPHAEVHEYPDCGHYVLQDAAKDIIPLINEFIRRD